MAANGRVAALRAEGRGPTIWLAGTPDELREWMPLGIAGIVTNTVVLNQYAKQYGSVIELIKQYLVDHGHEDDAATDFQGAQDVVTLAVG